MLLLLASVRSSEIRLECAPLRLGHAKEDEDDDEEGNGQRRQRSKSSPKPGYDSTATAERKVPGRSTGDDGFGVGRVQGRERCALPMMVEKTRLLDCSEYRGQACTGLRTNAKRQSGLGPRNKKTHL